MSIDKPLLVMLGFGVFVASVGVFLPKLGRRTNCGMDVVRQTNLHSLATAMKHYVEDFDGQLFPAEQWHDVMDPWLGIDRQDGIYFPDFDSQFYLLPVPWEDLQVPKDISKQELSKIPFMFEEQKLSAGGTSVVFWDGSVYMLEDDELADLINLAEAIPLGIRKQRSDP